jgi:thiamine biosynthesis lipoprotein ApbE
MATRFELLLDGDGEAHLRAAGEEALATIQRLEAQLSFYRATSDVGRINANAARQAVRVGAELFQLLVRARELNAATDGRFDITVGPLMRCWRFAGGEGAVPDAAALQAVRQCVGMELVELDEAHRTVRFARRVSRSTWAALPRVTRWSRRLRYCGTPASRGPCCMAAPAACTAWGRRQRAAAGRWPSSTR